MAWSCYKQIIQRLQLKHDIPDSLIQTEPLSKRYWTIHCKVRCKIVFWNLSIECSCSHQTKMQSRRKSLTAKRMFQYLPHLSLSSLMEFKRSPVIMSFSITKEVLNLKKRNVSIQRCATNIFQTYYNSIKNKSQLHFSMQDNLTQTVQMRVGITYLILQLTDKISSK